MGSDGINLRDFLSYPLTPIPYCIGTLDGFLAKTNKSKGFQWLINNVDSASLPIDDGSTLVVEDGNAIFHYLTDVPETFGQIAEKLFYMMSRYQSVVFSTDMYMPKSVKSG